MSESGIIKVNGFFVGIDCETICQLHDRHAPFVKEKDYSGWPVVYWEKLKDDPWVSRIIKKVVHWVIEDLARHGHHDLCPETILTSALGVGGCHALHADSCKIEDGEWVPNHTPQRKFSAIIYLNDKFEGGEIDFPERGERHKPATGMMIAFPSDHRYVHQVLPVTSGKRYSLALWFTDDSKHELKL